MLLTRDKFREAVFKRDSYKCLVCDKDAKDAHHILERRLFDDSGYYLDNGASVCEEHHIEAEQTTLGCDQLRDLAGIKVPFLPPHLYPDTKYDKWGNVILENGTRLKGDLFFDESVQKILKQGGVLDLFGKYVKYPRTYHLPWSGHVGPDDRMLKDLSCFMGREVIITEKMDGENTSMYDDHIHARSLSSKAHPSRNWVKNFHSQIQASIPPGWRICGENMFAQHSIPYDALDSWFLLFSIWDDRNTCLSWEETQEWASLLGLKMVKTLYRGQWDQKIAKHIADTLDREKSEGYVIRVTDSFSYRDFRKSVAKYVRPNHVQTHGHWMRSRLTQNGLKE